MLNSAKYETTEFISRDTSGDSVAAQSGPVGEGDYTVSDGDCLASIAYSYGLLPETIWNALENSVLRQSRRDMKMLLPGDRVHIPPRQVRGIPCRTDQRHRFIRNGVPEQFRMILLNDESQPRADVTFHFTIDGRIHSGVTDGTGLITCPIQPNAKGGSIELHDGDRIERYEIRLGWLDPTASETGIRARLTNIGLLDDTGSSDELFEDALRFLQTKRGRSPTGLFDADTRNSIIHAHGF